MKSFFSLSLFNCTGATLQALEPSINRLIRLRPSELSINTPCSGQNGMNGTCMYSIECIKGRGVPIGVCLSSFLVRSCCKLPTKAVPTTLQTTTSTTTTPSPTTTTLAPVTRAAAASSTLSTVNKQMITSSSSEKFKQPVQQFLTSTTSGNKILSTRLTSTEQQQTSTSTTTQKPKTIESLSSEQSTTSTARPTSAKASDQHSTNSPTLIETTNDVLEVGVNDNSIISNEFNEKLINQSNSTVVGPAFNFTNEFTSSSSTQVPNNNLSTTLSALENNTSDSGSSIGEQFISLEKKNVASSTLQDTTSNSMLVTNTLSLTNNISSNSSPYSSTTLSTTAIPTTLKYIDLLKPLNKTSPSSLSPINTSSSTASVESLSSLSTTETSQSSTTVSNTQSHRVAIVYNPTTSTTTTTTTSSPPLSIGISNNNETGSINSIEPVNIKAICGKRLNVPKGRMVGGTKSYFGEYPWMISLRQWKKNAFLHKCGAALLNDMWAITAAHCIENISATDLLLRLGEYDVSNDKEPFGYIERRVQIIASHPQFNPRTFEYDLALLRFYEKVPFRKNIIPVCLPESNETYVNKWATVTGWGRLYEDGPLPDLIQHVKMPIITNKECEQMYNQAGYIEDIPHIFICAGLAKGGRDSCEGDSGGPLVLEENGRWNLIGIISWGIGCGVALQPGVYTRISEFTDWIHQIINF